MRDVARDERERLIMEGKPGLRVGRTSENFWGITSKGQEDGCV